MPGTIEDTLCRIVARRDGEMRDDLARFVAIPTGHNHTPGLDEFRGIVTDRLRAIGARVEMRAGDERPEWLKGSEVKGEPSPVAVCRVGEASLKRGVMLASHLDTVFDPAGRFREMVVSSDDATATGPGVVDMKGGIVIGLVALEALAEAGVDLGWTWVFNSDEETGSFCSDRVLREVAAEHRWGIATEPALAGGELAIARKGSGQFRVEAIGRSAHAGRAFHEGVSAVYALAHALVKIEGMSDVERGTTVNVGPVVGGTATNVVPDRAYAWGNVRYVDPAAAESVGAQLDALSTDKSEMPRLVMERSFNRPAKPRLEATDRLAMAAREVAESLGQKLPFAETGGVCDGNNMQAAGLPTIDTLGVRGGGLHTEQEWIELGSLVERGQLLACLLARLARDEV